MTEPRLNAEEKWSTRTERGHVAAIELIVWIALHLGRPATRILLYPICLYFLFFSRASRTASRGYLARVLGRKPTLADCFRHYFSFASCVLDRVYLLNNQLQLFELEIEGESLAIAELERGAGCFLFGAHFGSFEVLRALAHRQAGLKLSLLMYEENARKINSVLNAINPALTLEVIALGQSDSVLAVKQRLEEGHFIGVLADRDLSPAEDTHARLPFLGGEARFPLGPFRLAALLQRPVLLMIGLYRGGRHYEVHFEPLADFTRVASRDRPEAVNEALRRYIDRLAYYCRIAPYNWFNFYDFWK